MERDQPLHAADLQEAEGRREVHHDRAQGLNGCTVVAADILDQADTPARQAPDVPLARSLHQALPARATRAPRTICGVHNYSDINRFRNTGTKAIIKALGCKQIWLTEAGGIYKFTGFKRPERQLKATKYMFKVARRNKKIKRLYVYTWFGAVTPRFDAGLVANGSRARPTRGQEATRSDGEPPRPG